MSSLTVELYCTPNCTFTLFLNGTKYTILLSPCELPCFKLKVCLSSEETTQENGACCHKSKTKKKGATISGPMSRCLTVLTIIFRQLRTLLN